MEVLAGIITALFGLYLTSLFAIALVKKKSAINYFSSFASSAKSHYLEQFLRLTMGIGLIISSNNMMLSELFRILGLTLMMTSIVLLITPWKWHYKFGLWAIPLVIKNVYLYTLSASLLGILILYCLIAPLF